MSSIRTKSHDALIMSRVVGADRAELPAEAARAFLRLAFPQKDIDRMHALALKAQEGNLLASEQDELESYRRVGYFLDLMRAKARKALKKSKS